MPIIINFEDTYEPLSFGDNLTSMAFNAPQKDGREVELFILISPHSDPLLPNVYNLGFGPPDGNGSFLDDVRLNHQSLNKLFSTVIFHALNFLLNNPELTIGVDGSDDLRARLYHGMFKSNRGYLADYFLAIGVDWYVRIFRDFSYEQEENGHYVSKPRPEPFDYVRDNRDLYRYYMFRLI